PRTRGSALGSVLARQRQTVPSRPHLEEPQGRSRRSESGHRRSAGCGHVTARGAAEVQRRCGDPSARYSIAAADVTPLALGSRRLGAEVSQGILTLTLGTVAVEQNRRLFDIDPAAAAENFAANAAQMLH